MASAPYILARTFSGAHAFARGDLGLVHGQYRVVTSVSTIKSVRGADLHLVPGWERRFDGHTMRTALRWTRMNVIDHSQEQAEAPTPETDGLEPAGTQPEITEGADPALVAEFEAFLNGDAEHPHDDAESTTEPESTDEPEQAEAPVEEPAAETPVRRRRRCKECGLLVDPDEVDEHAASHLPTE